MAVMMVDKKVDESAESLAELMGEKKVELKVSLSVAEMDEHWAVRSVVDLAFLWDNRSAASMAWCLAASRVVETVARKVQLMGER